jgi:hypothetical protein
VKPIIYLISGVCASGKSWVCNQLTNCIYVSFDGNPKKNHLTLLEEASKLSLPIVYDPTFKISTFIRRHNDLYDIRPVLIIESKLVLMARIAQRGGTWTPSLDKRIIQIEKRAIKYGIFSGTSNEVLVFMRQQLEIK